MVKPPSSLLLNVDDALALGIVQVGTAATVFTLKLGVDKCAAEDGFWVGKREIVKGFHNYGYCEHYYFFVKSIRFCPYSVLGFSGCSHGLVFLVVVCPLEGITYCAQIQKENEGGWE